LDQPFVSFANELNRPQVAQSEVRHPGITKGSAVGKRLHLTGLSAAWLQKAFANPRIARPYLGLQLKFKTIGND
jgi:hypothetical protein